jgi:hypothetical protein
VLQRTKEEEVTIPIKDAPYTGPYFGPGDPRGPNRGPTAKALKRFTNRVGTSQFNLAEIDDHYNAALESAIKKFQGKLPDVQNSGQYGKGTWRAVLEAKIPPGRPNSGENALDTIAQKLIRAEAKATIAAADPSAKIRAAITDFCLRAEVNEGDWHYTQQRPYTGVNVAPELVHHNDCSSYVVLAYSWAKKITRVNIPDPSGYTYNGYGNTWDNLDGHQRVSGNYLVGDLAHYDGHVTICRKPGNSQEAIWSSFGWEGGPEPHELFYRDDLLSVVRPPLK